MRLIDADALLNSGFPTIYHTEFGDEVINTDDIRNAPTVELHMGRMIDGNIIPIERPTGHWINHYDDLFPEESTEECSICHQEQSIGNDDNYCPNCGAKMKGAEE